MKTCFIIILLSTCVLFGCEGNNQKKNDANNKPATTVDSVKADDAATESEPVCDMKLVWDQIEKMYMEEYLFKDGKLTESELQDELNGFKEAYFDEDDLVAIDEEGNRTVFFWNGKKMEKKE